MGTVPLPEGYQSVNPYIVVDGAEAFMAFLAAAFSATQRERITRPDGLIAHAEMRVGNSVINITDPSELNPAQPCSHYLYVDDIDATYAACLTAGATSVMEPANRFYGNREGGVMDPFGNKWWIATLFEDVHPDELQERFNASRPSIK